MTDKHVTDLLSQQVPSFDAEPSDWMDVMRRVRAHRRRRATLTVVIAAGFVLMLPPVGLAERVVDWFHGSPATPEVRKAIERPAEVPQPVFELLREQPGVDASRASGVLEIETSRGPIRLWSAPREDGGACAFIEVGVLQGRAVGSEACHPPIRNERVHISADLRPIDVQMEKNGLIFALVFGWKPGIDVEIAWSDGSRSRLPVTDGYALAEVKAGVNPIAASAVRGKLVLSTLSLVPPQPIPTPPASAYRVVAQATTFDGRKVTLSVASSGGKPCEQIEVSGASGSSASGGCGDVGGPITVNSDLSAGVLFGRVTVPAEELRIHFQDGGQADVAVTEGVSSSTPSNHRISSPGISPYGSKRWAATARSWQPRPSHDEIEYSVPPPMGSGDRMSACVSVLSPVGPRRRRRE